MLRILEGVSGVGKTTNSGYTFDFTKYLVKNEFYKQKHQSTFFQSLYDLNLNVDFLKCLAEIPQTEETVVIDRSPLSQIVYTLLFENDGDTLAPETFKTIIDLKFTNEICETIKETFQNWMCLVQSISKKNVELVVILAKNVEFTAEVVKERGDFDSKFNIKFYIQNQNYLFKKIYDITKVGSLLYVDSFFFNKN